MIASSEDRTRLAAVIADRNRLRKHVDRTRIVLHSADRLATAEVGCAGRQCGVGSGATPKPGSKGFCGTRPGARARRRCPRATWRGCSRQPAPSRRVSRPADRAGNGESRWYQPGLGAAHLGGSPSAAAPPASFKRSSDLAFAEKVEDIIGLYMDPPAHAVVLSIDEKSPIQALGPYPARPADQARQIRDHDPRLQAQCTTTLFAALGACSAAA